LGYLNIVTVTGAVVIYPTTVKIESASCMIHTAAVSFNYVAVNCAAAHGESTGGFNSSASTRASIA
jgi:hypothetical protein